MLKFLKFLISIPISVLLVYWVLANMGDVNWTFSPIHEPLSLPIGYLFFGFFLFGFLSGVIILWLNALPAIFEKWRLGKETKKQKKRLEMLEDEAIYPSSSNENKQQQLQKS